ncbi:alpha/beta fold hydrolase [Shimazuella kribbensis]|uniref:alpha/beta fold hydrolase n=1 Tax=Shimazuella kribbensis TaxID=139808 RepID=UPI0004083A69|nr:alpha/beta fold hydrolase [Shimazuella kribbensis]
MTHILLPYKDHRVRLSVNIRVKSNKWIVFLHGLGCTKDSFQSAFHTPDLQDYSLCAFDFLGFGESDSPDYFSYHLEDQSNFVASLIQYYSMNDIHIVAHSMGGAIGLLALDQIPHVSSFINVEGNLVSEDCGIVSRRVAAQNEHDFIQAGFMEFIHSLEKSEEISERQWSNWCQQGSPLAFYRSACSLLKWSESGILLSKFQSFPRKAYIRGEKNPQTFLNRYLKKIKTYVIPDSGHFMMMDNPNMFYQDIKNWIEKIDQG